jgi:hypothetical protein
MRSHPSGSYEEVQDNVCGSRQTNKHGFERWQVSSVCPVRKNWHEVEGLIGVRN